MSTSDHEAALAAVCGAIAPADGGAAEAARRRLDRLTKPPGSLGRVEELIVRLAAATGRPRPRLERRAVVLAAADHGVAAEGVSAYPQAVTAQMVLNYLAGGAAINALAAAAGAEMVLVDAGVAAELPPHPRLRRLGLRRGTANLAREPAMGRGEALAAVMAGVEIVDELWKMGIDLVALGEMGIANTTPAAALTSYFTGADPALTVGRGTGVDDEALVRKRGAVARGLARAGSGLSPLGALAELGGLEIAVLAGVTLGAARRRVPVLLDGYITGAAALVAGALAPAARGYLFAAHRSAEPGHGLALDHLGLRATAGAGPLLDLGLRLGEGSGAALAMPLLAAAARLMDEMATFDEAGVAEA